MTPPTVSNTSPLISLVSVGLLDLLPQTVGPVIIPEQVYLEYVAGARPHDPDLREMAWLTIVPVPTVPAIGSLGFGECGAIPLALADAGALVLLDALPARRAASQRELAGSGAIGVLVEANQRGLVPAVAPLLDALIAQGMRIGSGLHAQALQVAGEI